MKRHFNADLDNSLKDLDDDFLWKKKRKRELKNSIFTHIENLEYADGNNKTNNVKTQSEMGDQRTKLMKKKRIPKWVITTAASVMIIATAIAFSGTSITNAADTLFDKVFGSKEDFSQAYPDETKEEVDFVEQKLLPVAKEVLSEEEYNEYIRLFREMTEINSTLQKENRLENATKEEEKRLDEIYTAMETYQSKFEGVLIQSMVNFTFVKPAYIPEGYKLVEEDYGEPEFGEFDYILEYTNGESSIQTTQANTNVKIYEDGFLEKAESYSSNGYQFKYAPANEDWSYNIMRVTVPEKAYKIIINADELSKNEMEKILLSMVEG